MFALLVEWYGIHSLVIQVYSIIFLNSFSCLQPKLKKLKSVYLCPHCDKNSSWKTYSDHQRLCFNVITKQWIRESVQHISDNTAVQIQDPKLKMYQTSDSPPLSPTEPLSFTNFGENEMSIEPPSEGIYIYDA